MAIITKGITGGIRGKIGEVIGYDQNGQSIIRSRKLASKNPKSKTLSQNGKNLLLCVETFKRTLPGINELLKANHPELSISWNDVVSQTINEPTLKDYGLLAPMSLGISQFKGTHHFLAFPPILTSFVSIRSQNANSIKVTNNNAMVKSARFDSINGLWSVDTFGITSNWTGYGSGLSGQAPGYFAIQMIWIYDAVFGLKSKVGIVARLQT